MPDWVRAHADRVEAVLERVLPSEAGPAAGLASAMRYATLGGGKRIRALLVYAAAEMLGAQAERADSAAAAVELVHSYSLVHDDLPCMDDDSMRRGKPTCHVAFGEAGALLAGDALQALAFEVLARAPIERAAEACATLAQGAGVGGMAGGQAIDLAAVGRALSRSKLETMHKMKTGALIRASVRLGALCAAEADETAMAALDSYAANAGLAFQVVDDVLDVSASSTTLGKTAGKDEAQGKPTYVALLGLAGARDYASALREQAIDALAPFGSRAGRLAELADRIILRQH